MSRGWRVSNHACDRWIERMGTTHNTGMARKLVRDAASASITVPNRLARKWLRREIRSSLEGLRQGGIRYRFGGGAILITRGHFVITVIPATVEDYATVLVWKAMNHWVDGDPKASREET